MKRELGITLIIIALVIGVLVGYGVWDSTDSEIADLESRVQHLAQQYTDLLSQFQASGAVTAQAPETPRTVLSGITEEEKR